MGWQQRGSKRYYYRNHWQNGRSVRTYLGTGEIAELAATADALRHVEQERGRRQRLAEQEQRTAVEITLDQLCEQTDLLVRAALMAAGYHQHARSTWRKKRAPHPTDRED